MTRQYRTSRTVRAGCFACYGSAAHWHGLQAQGTAAQHHDKTGHETWVEVNMSIVYGSPADAKPAAPAKPPAKAALAGFVGLPPKPKGSR